jgi:hypothetical protein
MLGKYRFSFCYTDIIFYIFAFRQSAYDVSLGWDVFGYVRLGKDM